MRKILSIIILTTILIVTGAAPSMAAWQLTLEVSTPDPNSDTGIASNKLSIGTDQDATDSYDNRLDTIALLGSPAQASVQAYIYHPEYPSSQQRLWRDFRSDSLPKEWVIEVQSNVGSSVNINWEINAPDDLKFTLTDQDTNQEISMTSSSEYSFSNTLTMPKKFLLKVAENTNSSTSGGGSSRGGGCGYIKNAGQKSNSMKDYGQIALNMIILITPLLLSLQHYVRRNVFIIVKRLEHADNNCSLFLVERDRMRRVDR